MSLVTIVDEFIFLLTAYIKGLSSLSSIVLGWRGSGLVPCLGGPPDASVGFYLREALQSQANTENILYNKSR